MIKKKLKTKKNKNVIHLDLYDSNQIELMKDFLYSFLITKLYGQNEELFYLSKDVEIKIEIPNGFVDFFLKFPILNMFKNKTYMKIDNLPPLIVDKEINSNIQIVCNYLKLLKSGKLADKDLYIKNISYDFDNLINEELEIGSTKIDAEPLDQEECQKLIKEYLGIENPTYYQINSFINVLSGQLKKFSMNAQLSSINLLQNTKFLEQFKLPYKINNNLKNIRVKMVKSFIENTKHFTKGAFDKLLNSQMETFKVGVEQGNYNEDKQNDIAIKALSKEEETISFDKIKPSLIFFHEGEGKDFSIITTSKPEKPEYNEILELRKIPVIVQNITKQVSGYHQGIEELPSSLNDYSKFKNKDFFKEIKEILNINNPIYTSEKNEENKDLKSIEEIVGEYVFTSDNFIKMILILLRIRENIPVIMMGETGCGKTSLIRKLSELINNGKSNMKILNIHAGITDQEIVDFLYKKKKKKIEKLIVLLKKQKFYKNKKNQ